MLMFNSFLSDYWKSRTVKWWNWKWRLRWRVRWNIFVFEWDRWRYFVEGLIRIGHLRRLLKPGSPNSWKWISWQYHQRWISCCSTRRHHRVQVLSRYWPFSLWLWNRSKGYRGHISVEVTFEECLACIKNTTSIIVSKKQRLPTLQSHLVLEMAMPWIQYAFLHQSTSWKSLCSSLWPACIPPLRMKEQYDQLWGFMFRAFVLPSTPIFSDQSFFRCLLFL